MSEPGAGLAAQAYRREVAELARQVWSFCVAHVAVLLAVSTALIYGIGLARTMAQLHAAHVQTLRGLPLSALQEYFITGLAVIFSPSSIWLLGVFIGMLAMVSSMVARVEDERGSAPEPEPDRLLSGGRGIFNGEHRIAAAAVWLASTLTFAVFVAGVVLILPLTVVKLYAATTIASLLALFVFPISASPAVRAKATVSIACVGLAVSLLSIVYLIPPPLDRVTIRATNGHYVHAKLLTQTSSMVYVVGPSQGEDASIVAFPTDRIARMEITPDPNRHGRSLADALGLRFLTHLRDTRWWWPPLLGAAQGPIG